MIGKKITLKLNTKILGNIIFFKKRFNTMEKRILENILGISICQILLVQNLIIQQMGANSTLLVRYWRKIFYFFSK